MMMAPSRGVCFEGRMFFVYDREAVKKEADPPEDAILYFYPPGTGIHQQITICGQLVGMANFLSGFTGRRSPTLVKLKTEKVAMLHVGKYSLYVHHGYHVLVYIGCQYIGVAQQALGGTLIEPDSLMSRQLQTLYHVFAFYHGSIDHVRKMHQEQSSFLSDMNIIWDCYLPFVRHYGDHLPGVFDPVPFLALPKKAASGFMKASHFLQACQRRRHVLVGCLLYNNSVLCTQLDPDITSRVLLLKPNQCHHPAQPVKTDFTLPFGLRILDCFVTLAEYVTVYDALAQSPYRQLSATNSSGTLPDVYSTSGNYERNKSPNTSMQSNVTNSHPQGSSNRDVGEGEKLRDENSSKKSDSSEGECRSGQVEGCELAENREENAKDLSFLSSAQAAELADSRGPEKHVDLEDETVGGRKKKDTAVVPRNLVKNGSLQSDGDACHDGSHSPTLGPAVASCEQELVMEAINVQELRVIEHCFEESEGESSSIIHQGQAPQASVTRTKLRQPTSEREGVCSEGGSTEADCEDTQSVSEYLPLDRTVHLASEASNVFESRDLESLCRVFLDDIIDQVTAGMETRESFNDFSGAVGRLQETVVSAAGGESSRVNVPETCATSNNRSNLSNETSSSDGDGMNRDSHVSFEDVSSPCVCSCRDSSASEAKVGCINDPSLACDSLPTRNHNVKFEKNIKAFCVKESVGEELDRNGESQEEERKVAEDTDRCLEAQTDSTASSVTHIQSLETDSGVSLNNSQTEENGDVTPGAHDQELGESDVIAGVALDSGRTSLSSLSRDEVPLEEEEKRQVNQVEGMVHVNLYVQAHSEIVLILLAEAGLKSDQEAIKALWETSLNQFGELDALVKQSVGSIAQSDTKEDFSYLVYDKFEKAMKANLREPVTQADHVFCDTAKFVHEQFNNCPSLRDVTLRSRSSGVYCKRSLGRETYFQQKGSFRAVPGVPSPRDPTFNLEKRTSKVLLKEHGINVF